MSMIKKKVLPPAPAPRKAVPSPAKVEEIIHRNKRKAMQQKAQEDRERIYRLYKKGLPRAEIARRVGVEKATVVGVISKGFVDGDLKEYVVSSDEKQLIELYESGLSYKEMAKEMNLTEGSISGMLTRLRKEGFVGYRK